MNNKICKSKNCTTQLPEGYKHIYCECCRNKHTEAIKKGLKVAGSALCITATVVTLGKFNPKK